MTTILMITIAIFIGHVIEDYLHERKRKKFEEMVYNEWLRKENLKNKGE